MKPYAIRGDNKDSPERRYRKHLDSKYGYRGEIGPVDYEGIELVMRPIEIQYQTSLFINIWIQENTEVGPRKLEKLCEALNIKPDGRQQIEIFKQARRAIDLNLYELCQLFLEYLGIQNKEQMGLLIDEENRVNLNKLPPLFNDTVPRLLYSWQIRK